MAHRPELLLRTAVNLRDLGGYATSDGRSMRRGWLYRSGTLAYLDNADRLAIAEMGLKVVIDLRTLREAGRDPPMNWGMTRRLHWDYDRRELGSADYAGVRSSDEMRGTMLGLYRRLPWVFAPQISALLTCIVKGELPLLFHCSAGKDRTGITAALILSLLRVPREIIFDDYAVTEQLVDFEKVLVARALQEGRAEAAGHHGMTALAPELRVPLLRSDPDYLQAAFDAIEERHGSVETFAEAVLGVDAAMANRLRLVLTD